MGDWLTYHDGRGGIDLDEVVCFQEPKDGGPHALKVVFHGGATITFESGRNATLVADALVNKYLNPHPAENCEP